MTFQRRKAFSSQPFEFNAGKPYTFKFSMQGSFVDLDPTTSECRESVFPSLFKTGKLYPFDLSGQGSVLLLTFKDREAVPLDFSGQGSCIPSTFQEREAVSP